MRHQGNPGQLFRTNIAITLRVGLISLLSSGILIATYILNKSNESNKSILNFVVATLSASATITGTFYVGKSIRQSAESQELDRKLSLESQKIDRTLLYIQRWNDSHYSSFKKLAYQIHLLIKDQHQNQKGRIVREEIEKNPDLRMEVTEVLNFLEEMALCIKRDIIKEDLAVDFYRSIVLQYCDIFGVWIAQLRNEKEEHRLYQQLTDLYGKWKDR
ncbi:DUF4760 domain-containing protein [Limnofasciculus baicalensis]|uniref:DUF4760 domain-containing protein n=1 Tax=Limnofasciculus baicalensis TaxID=3064906 RepID=UPI0020A7A780|nr:DUF4760 domain-containing protein [Limnofasciculus baicalensis]